jgi:SAM-dependent methyltransferase
MSSYIFNQTWQSESARLWALEDAYDGASTRHLAERGVGPGWRCLEVGCGAGSVARWLAERVGASGRVLATDLDLRFVEEHGHSNLEVRRHDILTDPLEQGSFDLAHERALLVHVPDRQRALERMVAAVRPGGWIVAEDPDHGGAMIPALRRYIDPPQHAELWERIFQGLEALFTGVGADASFGPRLPRALAEAGLERVSAELHTPLLHGGAASLLQLTIQQLQTPLAGTGLVTDREIERFLELLEQPSFGYLPFVMVTAWGRRPAAHGEQPSLLSRSIAIQ